MNKAPSDRPNRMVTCPECGAQMPQRFLAKHQKQHEPAEGQDPGAAPVVEKEHVGTQLCPACGQFVTEVEFSLHMAENHPGWCPLCRALPKDLLDHLKRSHHVKPLQPSPGFGRNWQNQTRFVCLWCKKNISVWSYPKHAQPHRLRPKEVNQKPPASQDQENICPYCQKSLPERELSSHIASHHPGKRVPE